VKTNPPFDYLAYGNALAAPYLAQKRSFSLPIPPKRVQFLRKPLKSSFLRIAITELHA